MIRNMLNSPWVLVGFMGQFNFMMRFVVQWLVSERKKRSVIPVSFWYLSIGGGGILLAYAIWRRDPVFIAGQSLGILVYFRNLVLLCREGSRGCDAEKAL